MGVLASIFAHAQHSAEPPINTSTILSCKKPHAQFQNPRTTPSDRKLTQGEEREHKKSWG